MAETAVKPETTYPWSQTKFEWQLELALFAEDPDGYYLICEERYKDRRTS